MASDTQSESAGNSYGTARLPTLHFPELKGKSFLDIGCNDGFVCNIAKERGAIRVVGIEESRALIETARTLYPNVDEFLYQSWDLLPNGPFDVILHSSALHHAADPHQLIRQIHGALADDGIFILECFIAPGNHAMQAGVYELGGAFWERASIESKSVLCPSEALLRNSLLLDFSVRAVGNGIRQKDDPFPRKVFHCRKFRPIVLMVGGPGGAGKTTLAVELQRHGVATFNSDYILQRLATNAGQNTGALWSLIKGHLDRTNAIPLYGRLNGPEWAGQFASEIVAMLPKNHRLLVLEGYAFSLDNIRGRTRELLQANGFVVHQVGTQEWRTQLPPPK